MSELRKVAVVDAIIDGVTITDMQGKVTDLNQAAARQLGYEKEEAIGKTPVELFIVEREQPRFFETLKKLLSGEPVAADDYVGIRKDGTEFPISVSLSLLRDAGGKPEAIVAVHRDVTERKRMEEEIRDKSEQLEAQNEELRTTEEELRATEEELRASNEELQSTIDELKKAGAYSEGLIKSMVDGLGVLDLEGKVIDVNETLLGMLGWKKEEVLGVPLYQSLGPMVEPAEMEKVSAQLGQLMAGVPVGAAEMVITAKNGTQVTISLAPSVVRDAKGKPIMLFAVMRDITERKRMEEEIRDRNEQLDAQNEELRTTEEELRSSNEEIQTANEELREMQEQIVRSEKLAAIGQLAGGVGHELRNPLGAIKNAVYYVRGKLEKSELSRTEPRVMEFLEIVDEEINSSNKIISDLLSFSRVGKPATSPARIGKVIEDAIAHTHIPEGVELTSKIEDGVPDIEIDTDQIRQVLVNVMTNAVQAMPEGGKLMINTRAKDNFLEVKIADTGQGIPEENLGKIFDPLYTLKAKGIGLGLAVCKSIIDRHGGQISVESVVDKGTTFTVKLPMNTK